MKRSILLLALLGLVPALASAGEQANAPTVTGETGYFTLLTGDTLPRGGWSFGLYYNNWDRVIDVGDFLFTDNDDDDELAFDWNRLGASLGYGLTDNFEVSVLVPYDDYNFDNNRFPFVEDPDASGLGNSRLNAKWRLSGGPGADSSFAINAFVEFPTGDDDVASDDGGFGAGLDWRVRNWVFNAGYRDPGDDDIGENPTEILGGIGYAGAVSDRLDWITELVATFYGGVDSPDLAPEDSYDLTTGGRLWLGEDQNWAFNFALRADLNQIDTIDEHCPVGGLVGLTYFPRFIQRVAEAPPPPPVEAPPPPPPPPPAPAPKPEERVTVNFTPGSARLSNIAKAKLDEVALKMKQDPDLRAQVIGYTDPSGSPDANQRISEQRAQAVKNYLVTRHGIDPSRITTEGRGSADSTGDPEQDRRAVVILTVQ